LRAAGALDLKTQISLYGARCVDDADDESAVRIMEEIPCQRIAVSVKRKLHDEGKTA